MEKSIGSAREELSFSGKKTLVAFNTVFLNKSLIQRIVFCSEVSYEEKLSNTMFCFSFWKTERAQYLIRFEEEKSSCKPCFSLKHGFLCEKSYALSFPSLYDALVFLIKFKKKWRWSSLFLREKSLAKKDLKKPSINLFYQDYFEEKEGFFYFSFYKTVEGKFVIYFDNQKSSFVDDQNKRENFCQIRDIINTYCYRGFLTEQGTIDKYNTIFDALTSLVYLKERIKNKKMLNNI